MSGVTGLDLLMALFGVVTVGSALAVVTTRHLVRAALYLVVTLTGVAGCFLLLTAEFLAWVQVLIYVGAVVVLLLFGLMLTRAPIGPIEALSRPRLLWAAIVAVASAGVLGAVLMTGFADAYVDLGGAAAGDAGVTGAALFESWVLPFELVSLLLLAALVGAIALSRTTPDDTAGAGHVRATASRSVPYAARGRDEGVRDAGRRDVGPR